MPNHFRFEDLDEQLQIKWRRVHHLTTINTALRIVKSRHIWGKSPHGYANFSHEHSPSLREPGHGPMVSLVFDFLGEVRLVSQDFSCDSYVSNVLYIHLLEWPGKVEAGGIREVGHMQISAIRLAAGSTGVLNCVGCKLSKDLEERRLSLRVSMLTQELESAFSQPISISVPKSESERCALSTSNPPIGFEASKAEAFAFVKLSRQIAQLASH
jgi:hypothetical protein